MNTASYKRIAVIDIGKTNAKVVLLDGENGAEMAVRKTPNAVVSGGRYPHYDVEALWTFIQGALAGFAQSPGFDAISITTHGASAALLDGQGRLAMPVLDYEFEYPQEIRAAYAVLRPDFSETFSPPLSAGLNLGAQLHFQKTMFPEAFGRVSAILTYPQYWAYRLSGVAANEATSLGCHTDLWAPDRGQFSSLVDRLDIREKMAPVRSAFDALGSVRPELGDELGLSTDIPVFCGIHDSNASLLPHLILSEPPFAVVSTGTWVVCFATPGNLDGLAPERDSFANVNAFGKPTPSARFMGGREFEMLTQGLAELPGDVDETVAHVVGKSLMLLPNVAEGSGPFPGRRMKWIGTPASDAEKVTAISLYMALMTEVCLELIGAGGPTIVEGPMSRNTVYVNALASVTGRDVLVPDGGSLSGTALGAAMLTGVRPQHTATVRFTPSLALADYRRHWRKALEIP
ncbi:FGGY-family carbohydrate kinase [Agrobacterium tumefaciens]|uniref:FGGY-family carbohydrate kinase n=2 Tax=Pseudomonadota TaxID=1224 RepID=UPI00287CBB1E|nr:FGGY-family carbohydrate kinase [Agrobacterium tumefaciens]MDS7594520.1 FGGY-family carbohydrate kinase [Agrobacterium tumefaciens]